MSIYIPYVDFAILIEFCVDPGDKLFPFIFAFLVFSSFCCPFCLLCDFDSRQSTGSDTLQLQ